MIGVELALQAKGLQVVRQSGFAVSVADFSIAAGGTAALVGPSGSGKTTFLLGMLGLLADSSRTGELLIGGLPWPVMHDGQLEKRLQAEVCVINQDPKAVLDPLQRVGDQIGRAVIRKGREIQVAAIQDSLASLGIDHPAEILRRFPHQLSGGQCQRVLLAIALLRRPALLIADEPTSGLDGARQEDFLKGLRMLREQFNTATLLATHDYALVEGLGASPHSIVDGEVVPGWPARPDWPHREHDHEASELVLECRGVGIKLGGRTVLSGVDLSLHRGEVLALVGPSGAGKTTLAKIIAGHMVADEGEVRLHVPQESVQMLFQDAFASMTPHLTAQQQIEEVAHKSFEIAGEAKSLQLDHDRLEHLPVDMSGGERRRAALLRALSVQPEVLILDEPTASLDRSTATAVIESLLQVQTSHKMSVMMISHDMELANAVADRIVTIEGGRT